MMRYDKRQSGFTLVELIVAAAITASALVATGWIFKMGIDSYRISMATSEIMSNMRSITDQIDSDFAGLRKDGRVAMLLQPPAVTGPNSIRADRIWFAANGDFQAIQLYKKVNDATKSDWPLFGNVAVITYAMAEQYKDRNGKIITDDPLQYDPANNAQRAKMKNYTCGPRKVLARRQTILIPTSADFNDPCTPATLRNRPLYMAREYQKISFPAWCQKYRGALTLQQIRDLTQISDVNINNVNQAPLVLARGVEDFSIQILDRRQAFGAPSGKIHWVDPNTGSNSNSQMVIQDVVALKFGFTIYSKTLINGRPMAKQFTQVVWLRDE